MRSCLVKPLPGFSRRTTRLVLQTLLRPASAVEFRPQRTRFIWRDDARSKIFHHEDGGNRRLTHLVLREKGSKRAQHRLRGDNMSLRKTWLGMSLGLAVAMTASGAYAQQRNFDVASGPAVKSIPDFARQAGLQIIAPADQLKGVNTPQIKGAIDARAALKQLIAGTGLTIASDNGAVVSLKRVAPVPQASAAAATCQAGPPPKAVPEGRMSRATKIVSQRAKVATAEPIARQSSSSI